MDRFYVRGPYPWPIANPDPKLQEALDIAMDYLELTGQASPYTEVEMACATIIQGIWRLEFATGLKWLITRLSPSRTLGCCVCERSIHGQVKAITIGMLLRRCLGKESSEFSMLNCTVHAS